MTVHQISALQQDYQELNQYIEEVTKRGNSILVNKLMKKLDFLGQKIAEENVA
jgi:uncharacterized membrane protein (DUF106 family)